MNELSRLIGEVKDQVVELRHKIHQNPEPAYEEVETAGTVSTCLADIDGMEIQEQVGRTGVVATLGREKSGPCIALRADMDCLRMAEQNSLDYCSTKKGLMHGCGHDGHIACLVGAALVLGKMQDKLKGPVKFIFQPAEENYAGASAMIKDGALKDPVPSAIFGLHGTPSLPLGKIGLREGPMMAASRYFTITVKGSGSHAAMPHKGIDTVLVASHIVCAAHTIISRNINPMEAALISIPKFQGSTAPNVLPETVELQGTLRALSNTTREFLQKRLTEVVEHCAKSFGAEASIEFDKGYPLLVNEKKCTRFIVDTASSFLDTADINECYPPSLGSEDFSFYLEEVPGAFWWLGLGEDGCNTPLHNPCFDFNDKAIPLGIGMHCKLALRFNEQGIGDF